LPCAVVVTMATQSAIRTDAARNFINRFIIPFS
jgi:hypothetical protein